MEDIFIAGKPCVFQRRRCPDGLDDVRKQLVHVGRSLLISVLAPSQHEELKLELALEETTEIM